MASRSSSNYMSENYVGTRRGRAAYGDMDFSYFPEKYESTPIVESKTLVEDYQRDLLSDFTPEKSSLFAHEERRENLDQRGRLTLRETGTRAGTDPWIESGYNLQFMDKDPRGWSTEQNWKEYRRLLEAQLRMTSFKDDGDYSVPGQGIHPNTMYRQIRSSMNWIRSRLKIFSTSKDGRINGLNNYAHFDQAPVIDKVDFENTSVGTDGNFVHDAETQSNKTVTLANMLHGGSKFLRTTTTTDHEPGVAKYGHLRKYRGLMNHESQLRSVADDRKQVIMADQKAIPRNIIKLMSTAVTGKDAASAFRGNIQDADAHSDIERLQVRKDDELHNRNRILTRDILALMGFIEQDIKYLIEYQRTNKKHANKMLANLYKMAELVDRLPPHAKLEVRDELLLSAAGAHLKGGSPSGIRKVRQTAQVNPKLIELMDLLVRTSLRPGDSDANKRKALTDPENKLNNIVSNANMYVVKSSGLPQNIDANRREAKDNVKREDGKKTHSYKNLSMLANKVYENKLKSHSLQWFGTEEETQDRQNALMGDTNLTNDVNTTEIDNEFGENQYLERKKAPIGSKYMVHRVDTDYKSNDQSNEMDYVSRKNKYDV